MAVPRLPRSVVGLVKQKRECERQWKSEKTAFASTWSEQPPRSLVVAFLELKSKADQVRLAMVAFSRQKRGLLLKLMKSKTRRGVRQFWQQVSGKVKSSSEIQFLQRKSDGVLQNAPEDIAEEAYAYLRNIFDGVDGEGGQHRRQ